MLYYKHRQIQPKITGMSRTARRRRHPSTQEKLMIWLVDYTSYRKDIDPELARLRRDYFIIKSYYRAKKVGATAPVKNKVFSTGLLRIATILKRNGVDVRFMDSDMLISALDRGETLPEAVAFSAVCPTVPLCAALAERIKAQSPSTSVKLGGVHVNLCAAETARRFPVFDELTVGYEFEGAEKVAGRRLIDTGGSYVDYSLLPHPLSYYAINTFTAMGCPFRCDYCADGRAPHFNASPDGQLGEMIHLLPERTLVHFFDSVLGSCRRGIRAVCNAIAATGHKFLLSCDMRADLLTPELVRSLERAGFIEVRLGIESSDEELLKRNRRTLTAHRFSEQIRMIRDNSELYITLYSVTGLPGTTWESQSRTLDYFGELMDAHLADETKNGFYVPYPMEGVDYSARGVTSHYDRQSYPVYHTTEMSREELRRLYLYTTRRINENWLHALGFRDISEVPVVKDYYTEYVEDTYDRDGRNSSNTEK